MRWCWLLLLLGCDAPPKREPAPLGDALVRIDGETISPADVEQLVHATGITRERALRDLVSERLLVEHARPYAEAPAVARGVERALVRALLAREIGDGGVAEQQAQLEALLARLRASSKVEYREDVIQRTFEPGP
jgi:hypothetical protein